MSSSFAFTQAVLTRKLIEPSLKTKPSQCHIAVDEPYTPEGQYIQNMMGLLGALPGFFMGDQDYGFTGGRDEFGRIYMAYNANDKPESFTTNFIEAWQELLVDLIAADALEADFDPNTNRFTFFQAEALMDTIELSKKALDDVSEALTNIAVSTANSIFYDLIGREADETDDFYQLSQPHLAITRALKTVISTFDKTLDFEVIPTEENDLTFCRITMGRDTDISFEERFRALRQFYDEMDAHINDWYDGCCLEYAPDETQIVMVIGDTELTSKALGRIYESLDIDMKARESKARMYISQSELLSICREPVTGGLKFRPHQH